MQTLDKPRFLGQSVEEIAAHFMTTMGASEKAAREAAELWRYDGNPERWKADATIRKEFSGDLTAYQGYARSLRGGILSGWSGAGLGTSGAQSL